MPYSSGSGGTLTLPSPTHVHHVDVAPSVVRSLRRSLSRSPSKFGLAASASSASPGAGSGPTTPHSGVENPFGIGQSTTPPSPRPTAPATAAGFGPFSNPATGLGSFLTPQPSHTSSNPFRSSVKLSLRSARSKPATSRPLTRTRVSPKSPLKRVFGPSPDSGNQVPSSISDPEPAGQENPSFSDFALALSPATRRNLEKPSRHSMHLDVSGSSKHLSKILGTSGESITSITVSPLKRADAMSVDDQVGQGSPVAKRRSLHGVSSLPTGFNIFDVQSTPQAPSSTSQNFDIHEDTNQEYQLTGSLVSPFRDPAPSPTPGANMPKRTSSLRKSTLQQRHGETRTSWGRRAGEKQLAQLSNEAATPMSRNRPRLAMDQYLPPDDRGSIFSAQSPLPNPSFHPLPRPPNQPHPLSRTLTQSSSTSSDSSSTTGMANDSPTHVPVHLVDRPTRPNFSKSLPLGAFRPVADKNPMETPDYKRAKPFQAAFASTGLVSKMSRPFELAPTKQAGTKVAPMPDTPCKKQYNSATYPPQNSGGRRSSRPSFGSPSTPFGSGSRGNIFGTRERGNLLFQPTRPGHARKTSLLSMDGNMDADEHGEPVGSQDDFPPTPTKNFLRNFGSPAAPLQTPNAPRVYPFSQTPVGLGGEPAVSSPNTSPMNATAFVESTTPRTPQDAMAPLDASRLTISNSQDDKAGLSRTPATPTTQPHATFTPFGEFRQSITPNNVHRPKDVDESLVARFDKSEIIGKGEFSQVYRVTKSSVPQSLMAAFTTTPIRQSPSKTEVYAVKKLKLPFSGAKAREAKLREVSILRALSHSDKVVHYIDSWELNGHLYIQTEFCTEGSLDNFLKVVGVTGRVDDFRIWKILEEMLQGVLAIHNAGFIHLDLKPANIFITEDGSIKIGDFGMAVQWPAAKGVDGEGDREYIAPEILQGVVDKPADIFAIGLIILEIATNSFLPDNGPTWQALRSGDLSLVAPLTTGEALLRDATGIPIDSEHSFNKLSENLFVGGRRRQFPFAAMTHDPSNLFGAQRRREERFPPYFMKEAVADCSLDNVVSKMLHPDPAGRPTAQELLDIYPITWVNDRRTAGALIYEGNWGPVPSTVNDDTVMTGV